MNFSVRSYSAEQTRQWGTLLGSRLKGGDVVALSGDLGAGKTAFSQGVGEALGVNRPMTSPTFTLIHEYSGRIHEKSVRLIHMDLYRLQRPEEVEVIGVEEAFVEDAVCLIEWPEIAEDYLPDDRLDIKILGSGEQPREIIFQTAGSDLEERIKTITEVQPL